jgi:hypothetical protein
MSESVPLLGGGGASSRKGSSTGKGGRSSTWGCSRRALTLRNAVDASSRSLGVSSDDVYESVFALCSALDEDPLTGDGASMAVRSFWDAAFGGAVRLPSAVSHGWGYLGFQGTDPHSDLRSGSSAAALRIASHALQRSEELRLEAFRSALGAGPPFALAIFNIVHVLAAHLHLLCGRGNVPPAFCPCCGAGIRRGEYESRSAQSHGGASITGFVALVAEELRAASLAPLASGFSSSSPQVQLPLSPGEMVMAYLLELTLLRLGAAWRADGPGDDYRYSRASIEEINVLLREAMSADQRPGTGDLRQLNFPRFLANVRSEVMDALALVSRGASAPSAIPRHMIRSQPRDTSNDAAWAGGGYNIATGLRYRKMNSEVEVANPLESALDGDDAEAAKPLRASLSRELLPKRR